MPRSLALSFILAVVIAHAVMCSAQVEQAAVTGAVLDQTGAAVPGARVTITNDDTKVVAATATNNDGYYRIPYLPHGNYTLVAEKPGFELERITGISLGVGQTATINLTIKPGTVHQEVTVTAAAVFLEQQSSSINTVISREQVLQLPSSRNPWSLVVLAPGTMSIASSNPGVAPIASGGVSQTTELLFDGSELRNSTTNDFAYQPPQEAVGEVTFITNNFSAEYGRSGNAILTAAGVTGTNLLHGSAYEYFSNDILNANGWTNNHNGVGRGQVRHNEYGASLAGPVYIPRIYAGRNKTFFFFNWEQIKDHSPDNPVETVPTAAQRSGDFSQTFTNNGQLIKIYDPLTTVPNPASPGNYIRTVFPGNQIPTSRLNPIAMKLLSYYPLPTLPGITNNLPLHNTRTNPVDKVFVRIDQNFGVKNRLFFRYGYQVAQSNTPWNSVAFPGETTNDGEGFIRTTGQSAILSDTETFTANLVGEFRAGYTRARVQGTPRGTGFDYTALGLPSYLKASGNPLIFPEFDITGESGLGPTRAALQDDVEGNFDYQAHLTWIHGPHSLKSGVDFLFIPWNVLRPDYPGGDYSFSQAYTQGPNPAVGSATTGYGLATFLLGAPTGGSFTIGPALAASQRSYNWYLQDDWKVASNLTLNLGIRWEYQTPWTERHNHLSYFDPNANDPVTGLPGVLTVVGQNGASRYISQPQDTNFMPRIGLAYTFANNTVFRGGYGWFYVNGNGGIGATPGSLGSGSEVSTPVYLGTPLAAPNTPPPGTSLLNPFVTGLTPYPDPLVGSGINSVPRNWLVPLMQDWNANFERTIGNNLLIEAGYIGSRGEHIWSPIAANALNPAYLSLGPQLNTLVPNPFYGKITSGALSAPTITRSQALLPYKQYTGITSDLAPIGDSIYHALEVRVSRRLDRGFLFQSSYTFGKLIDNIPERFSGHSSIINPYDLRLSRAISDDDRSQVWISNFVYQLPFGYKKPFLNKGPEAWILGNWQIGGILTAQTGSPVVIKGPNNTNSPGLSSAAVRLENPNLPNGHQSINEWFNTAAFTAAAPYTFGNDSRTEPNLRNPGVTDLDLSLSRYQPIKERMTLQFRADLYNSTNHVNFNAPQGTLTAANFGQITSALAGRSVILSLRLAF